MVDQFRLLIKDDERVDSVSSVSSTNSFKKHVSNVFDMVKRKTMGGALGGGHTIDVEMTNRSSSFNFDNPMAKK
ncbi:hypothetical protein TrLO_g13349 [Triparma laevis f. longispina]|uniref:Uncharacterized protein n=1 Tax=Triparma laevis f. longispina TaxID=1714387 RepID=A0A9W7FHQ2_9STRA|nr:hypothetical protein TrLO_g13349 [Triparma laevis f. longispina]